MARGKISVLRFKWQNLTIFVVFMLLFVAPTSIDRVFVQAAETNIATAGGLAIKLDSGNVRISKGRGSDIAENKIEINTRYCIITIDSAVPVYYNYLSLGTKKYTVKQAKLSRAELIDGKYVIDYSDCKPTKSYCIGIGTKNTDYEVDGFSLEYLDQEQFAKASGDYEKTITWDGNKYYSCMGSDFDYMLQIDAYYSSEIDKVTGIKWNANEEDDVVGKDLIMSARITGTLGTAENILSAVQGLEAERDGIKRDLIIPKKNSGNAINYAQKNSWTYPFAKYSEYMIDGGDYFYNTKIKKYNFTEYVDDFPYDFIWREKGENVWQQAEAFTGKKLKDYLNSGVTLEIRFLVIHDYHTKNRNTYGKGVDIQDHSGTSIGDKYVIWGDRYGVKQQIKIPKAKSANAPKITISAKDKTISIKNGMQYSFDGEHWYTIYPYLNPKKYKTTSASPSFDGSLDFDSAHYLSEDYERLFYDVWDDDSGWDRGWYYSLAALGFDREKHRLELPYTFCKVSALSFDFLHTGIKIQENETNIEKYVDGTLINTGEEKVINTEIQWTGPIQIHVRKMAPGNGLPSKVATITLPTVTYGAPEVNAQVLADGSGVQIISIHQNANDTTVVNNPSYEYWLDDEIVAKNAIVEAIKKQYAKYTLRPISLTDDIPYLSFSWCNCKEGQTITYGKATGGVNISYEKNGENVERYVKKTVKIPFNINSKTCRLVIRRKGVENKKDPSNVVFASNFAIVVGDPSDTYNVDYK